MDKRKYDLEEYVLCVLDMFNCCEDRTMYNFYRDKFKEICGVDFEYTHDKYKTLIEKIKCDNYR